KYTSLLIEVIMDVSVLLLQCNQPNLPCLELCEQIDEWLRTQFPSSVHVKHHTLACCRFHRFDLHQLRDTMKKAQAKREKIAEASNTSAAASVADTHHTSAEDDIWKPDTTFFEATATIVHAKTQPLT